MSIGPVTRRKTSLDALWARWHDATRAAPSEPTRTTTPPGTKTLAPPPGLAGRQRRLAASARSLQQMAPRQPAPKAPAFNGTEVMAGVLNPRRKTQTKR